MSPDNLTPTQRFSPGRRMRIAAVLSGFVLLLFLAAFFGFLSTAKIIRKVVQYNQASQLANTIDTNFQLAISKGKNYAFLKNNENKDLSLGYLKKAREGFEELSSQETEPEGKKLVLNLELGLKNVEFPLGIFLSQARQSDPPEKLYRKYLKDITVDFDEASQAYVAYLNGLIRMSRDDLASKIRWELTLVAAGVLLSLLVIGLSLSLAQNLRQALHGEEALLEEEKRFRAVAQTAHDAILIWNEEGIVHYANPSVEKTFGYPSDELLNRPLGRLLHRGLAPHFGEILRRHLTEWNDGRTGAVFEFVGLHRNGDEIYLEGSFGEFTRQGNRYLTGILRDITGRWKMESDLRESQERLRVLDEVTEEAIMFHDQGVIVDVNQALCRLLEYEPSELIGKHLSNFMDQVSTDQTRRHLEKGYPEGSYEITAKRKNGTTFPLEVHGRDFEYRGRKLRVSSGWDITYRKRIEQAFIQSEERYRRFAEVTIEGIFIHDQGVIVDLNQAVLQMVGYQASELIGTDGSQLLDDKSKARFQAMRQTGYPARPYELNVRRKDGSVFPAEFHGRAFTYEGKSRRVVSVWDITERKKAEEELRKSEENFRNLIESAPDAVLMVQEGKVTYSNRKGLELLGFEKIDESSFDSLEMVHPDDRKTIAERVAKTLQGENNPSVEIRLKRKDGTYLPMESTSVGIQFQGKATTLVFARDITDRKKSEEILRRSEAKFRSLIENSYDLITVLDRQGRRLYEGPSLERVLGFKPGERQGLTFETQPAEDREKARKVFAEALDHPGVPIHTRLKALRKDGGTIDSDMVITNLLEDPAVGGIVVNGRDVTEKTRAEEALKISEEKFRSFIENSFDIFTLINEDSTIQYLSPSVRRVLGYDPAELMGKKTLDIVHPDDIPEMRLKMAKLIESPGSMAKAELRFRHKDGSWRDLEINAVNLLENPSVQGIVSNNRDITDRKRAEKALRESEENFRSLIENSNDVISLVGVDGKARYVSPSIKKVMGYEPGERLGHSFMELVHPDDQPRVRELFKEFAYKPGVTVTAEARARHKDGSWRYVDAVATNLLHHPSIQGIIFNYRDVTEKQLAEESLRQSEENFRLLIEKSPDAMLVHKIDRIHYVNPAFLKLLGYDRAEELVGRSPEVMMSPEDRDKILDRIKRLDKGEGFNPPAERKLLKKDGTIIALEVVSFSILFEGQLMVVAVMRDLTERKNAQRALMKFERLSTIGEMAAGLAHEIRNPLASISTAAQILKRKLPKNDGREIGYLETILEQSERLEQLVRDTMDYSRGEKSFPQDPFPLKPALEAALRLCQVQFGPLHNKVKVEWDLPEKEIYLLANPQRIQQILINLILNAYQVMQEGGTLRLRARSSGKKVMIRVEDSGPGIQEDDMNRLFEPFFTTKGQGSGLGLAISLRIAKEHGGGISVERLSPTGTAFILELPLGKEVPV